MWSVSAAFLPALAQSHGIATRIEVWQSGGFVATIPAGDGGTVAVTARNRVRRTLSLTAAESLWPTNPTDLLSPYVSELRVLTGINFGDHTELVPVFRGRIQTVERTYKAGQITIAASDRFADVNDDRFEYPRAAPTGTAIPAAIAALILETLPDAIVTDLTGSVAQVPIGLSWDRDRGQAIDDLATAIGAEVACGPDGNFTIRAVPTITGTPVWALADGAAGTVVSDVRSQSRDGVANSIVVLAENAGGQVPLRAVVRDINPGSPTVYGGPFGRATRFYSSPLITTLDQATTAGQALLARTIGITRQRNITCVPNPALDAGDVITLTVGGLIETHIADELTVPLSAETAMPIRTRSTRVDGGLT